MCKLKHWMSKVLQNIALMSLSLSERQEIPEFATFFPQEWRRNWTQLTRLLAQGLVEPMKRKKGGARVVPLFPCLTLTSQHVPIGVLSLLLPLTRSLSVSAVTIAWIRTSRSGTLTSSNAHASTFRLNPSWLAKPFVLSLSRTNV